MTIKAMADAETSELLALLLKSEGIDYSDNQLRDLNAIVDNHPINAHFAVKYAKNYGLASLLADSSELITWKR